jgi:hypothetical protein
MKVPLFDMSDGAYYEKVRRETLQAQNPPAGHVVKNQENPKIDELHGTGTGSIRRPQKPEVI